MLPKQRTVRGRRCVITTNKNSHNLCGPRTRRSNRTAQEKCLLVVLKSKVSSSVTIDSHTRHIEKSDPNADTGTSIESPGSTQNRHLAHAVRLQFK
ncbi:hypothetical protein RRG08_066879 [Elysia crispata]|uniref:Uncharacterized protein n=1 Tax=Elysia crispata TaxID=231223 RepID=A0AAE1CXV5_9GAST|nr:hypothetical protein RRG08_066879 [Elysia crispata]